MEEPILLREDHGAIARLTLNNPRALNALSEEMLDALAAAFTALAADETIRVVVLAANGKAFSAGHDLKQMQGARGANDGGQSYYERLFARCGEVMQMIPALPQPVIAEVHAIATAAGCQLVASCDMAVAADGAIFGVNGVNLGLFCSTPAVALARAVPRKVAFEMAATGEFISAARAREVGLVNRVVPLEELRAATTALAEVVAQKLPVAIRLGKQGFYDQIQQPLAAAYDSAGAVMAANMMDPGTDEGVQAFIEKRKPNWSEG
ncbi:enoyl-CoA hydratase [Sinisalibacter aestuarii]|uniref:Enoyl-CoA hydratase domain-containing protein 3, mitochondrial n=1 Tax=Sinisalibacter aestuarii TaxID=2949426 RepID=A0ABQ5LSX2_9RHOB|nr:enoyl-CoA hydratase [Sinisalibacter aestuarii]GKY88029.1 enoyl-CoA hydratase [Sinisalibacter aestuarii]